MAGEGAGGCGPLLSTFDRFSEKLSFCRKILKLERLSETKLVG